MDIGRHETGTQREPSAAEQAANMNGARHKPNARTRSARPAEGSGNPEQLQDHDGSELTVAGQFDFEGRSVRTTLIDDQTWFVAADVCRALNLAAHKGSYASHVGKLDPEEKRLVGREAVLNATPRLNLGVVSEGIARIGGRCVRADEPLLLDRGPTTWLVAESGLYTLILRSRDATTPGTLPYRFRRWVTGEVLPSIRRTGAYQTDSAEGQPERADARHVELPGDGLYVVTARPGRPTHICQVDYDAMINEVDSLDARIMACALVTIAAYWQRVQQMNAIAFDPKGTYPLARLERAVIEGADLAQRHFKATEAAGSKLEK